MGNLFFLMKIHSVEGFFFDGVELGGSLRVSGEICEFSINVNVTNRKLGNWITVNGAKTKSSVIFTGNMDQGYCMVMDAQANFPSNLVSSSSIWW
jgi:hypothetical protein